MFFDRLGLTFFQDTAKAATLAIMMGVVFKA